MQKLFSEKKQKVVIHKMKKEEEAMRTQEEKQDPQRSDPNSTVRSPVFLENKSSWSSQIYLTTGIPSDQL